MQKKRGKLFISNIAFLEIFLLVFASIAVSVLIGATNVSAATTQPVSSIVPLKSGTKVDVGGANIDKIPADQLIDMGEGKFAFGTNVYKQPLVGKTNDLKLGPWEPVGTISIKEAFDKTPTFTSGKVTVDGYPYENVPIKMIGGQKYAQVGPDNELVAVDNQGIGKTVSPGAQESGGIMKTLEGIFGGTAAGGGPGGALIAGFAWAGVAYGIGYLAGSLFGLEESQTKALSMALAAGGALTGFAQSPYGGRLLKDSGAIGKWIGNNALLSGIILAAVVFALLWSSEKKKMVTFSCMPFEPKTGGAKCEECNKNIFRPCSEYRCKSLGQACELLNKGTNNEQCTWVSRNDAKSPTITPWKEALSPNELSYITDTSIRPPALGVKIVKGNGCLQAFTPLQFGINTSEPAQCKIDYNHTASFDSMQYYFGGSNYFSYNHTQQMRLPGPQNGSYGDLAPFLKNDGTFSLYVRCQDANGNQNVDEYAISFCVDKSPDTTPPVIESTSINSGSPIRYNTDSVALDVYVNEPADCRWGIQDKAYEDMENPMNCVKEVSEINNQLLYTCSGNMTGIKNNENNIYYFRCKDQPLKIESERNVMTSSYKMILKGSQPLNILSVGPNGTISDSVTDVKIDLSVETDDGSDEGKALCYFSPTNVSKDFIAMFETNNYAHKQTLTLGNGNYKYYFRCIDAGGNAAESSTSFTVFVDKDSPQISRVYRETDALKFVTNEDAECAYSTSSCNFVFSEGIKTLYSNPTIMDNHYAKWDTKATYYVKCKDFYGNEPSPNECSLIANPIQLNG